jgi:signal peptidase II
MRRRRPPKPGAPNRLALVATILATVAAGFAARAAALRFLTGRPPVECLGGAVRFVLTENSGAFLGLGGALPETARRAVFVGVIAVLLAGLLVWLLVTPGRLAPARSIAAGLILGGGIVNLVDRLPDGLVTDYVVLSAGPLRTGIFNLPDSAILAGALLWLFRGSGRGYPEDSEIAKGGPR